jgi:hypothetical protein
VTRSWVPTSSPTQSLTGLLEMKRIFFGRWPPTKLHSPEKDAGVRIHGEGRGPQKSGA